MLRTYLEKTVSGKGTTLFFGVPQWTETANLNLETDLQTKKNVKREAKMMNPILSRNGGAGCTRDCTRP